MSEPLFRRGRFDHVSPRGRLGHSFLDQCKRKIKQFKGMSCSIGVVWQTAYLGVVRDIIFGYGFGLVAPRRAGIGLNDDHDLHLGCGMRFPTMWRFDKCRLRRAC